MRASKPDVLRDSRGSPSGKSRNGRSERLLLSEQLDAVHGGFINMSEQVVQVMKLLIRSDPDAAVLLLCRHEQLTYCGTSNRNYGADATKAPDGTWHAEFEPWRIIDDAHVIMDVPITALQPQDVSPSQMAHRSRPDRETLEDALKIAARHAGTAFDPATLQRLSDSACELPRERVVPASQVLAALGLEGVDERGRLTVNAPLMVQGPAALRGMIVNSTAADTRSPGTVVQFGSNISEAVEPAGTAGGKRRNLGKSQRLQYDLIRERQAHAATKQRLAALIQAIEASGSAVEVSEDGTPIFNPALYGARVHP